MTLNWKRERFDNLILLFNNQSLSMSEDSSNHILPFKFSPDEISSPININSTMRVNFSDKGEFTFCNREIKMAIGIHIFIKIESIWQVSKRFPEIISENSRVSCTVFFLCKAPVWFLIMIIPQKLFILSFKGSKCRTGMPAKDSLLPELIKTLNRGIPSRFSLRNEYQMNSHEQVQSNNMENTVRIASSTCGRHLIIHLGYLGNAHKSPCFNKMFAERNSLFIAKLACEDRMTCHIHSVEGIESSNAFWTSEISWANKVCLMEVSHLLGLNVRIWLIIAIPLGLVSLSLPVTRENIGNSRDRWNMGNLSLLKFPMDNLSSNARESRTSGSVRLQLFPDGEYLLNQILRSFSPDSFWGTALIPETFKSLFFIPMKPFGEPSFTPLKQLEYFVKTVSFFIKLYCFAAFFIFLLIIHRLFFLPKVFGRSLGDVKSGFLCYYIFLVSYVIR